MPCTPRRPRSRRLSCPAASPLLRALKALDAVSPENADQKTGVEIVRRAIQVPARQIAVNAGADGSIVVGKVMDQTDYATGWNAQTGEYSVLQARHHRPREGRAHGPSGRRVGGGPPRHHRGPDRRSPRRSGSGDAGGAAGMGGMDFKIPASRDYAASRPRGAVLFEP